MSAKIYSTSVRRSLKYRKIH